MKIRNRNKLMLILSVWLFSSVAFSQQSDSLMSYLKIAIENNPTVIQRYNEYQAAMEKLPQVGGLPDPQLEMGVFLSPMEVMSGRRVADIKLMQMFPWFGVLKNAKDEMSLMAKAKYETFRDAKLQVCYEVQQAWLDLYRIRQDIRISRENVELLKTIERLTLVRFRSGSSNGRSMGSPRGGMSMGSASTGSSSGMNSMGSNSGAMAVSRSEPLAVSPSMSSSQAGTGLSDVYQIQIERGTLEDNIASLKNEEQVAMARFNSTLNRPSTDSVYVPASLPAEPLDIAYLSVPDSVFARNPMLGMLNYEQQSLEARVKMQQQMGLPMVGVGVSYSVIAKSPMSASSMNGKDMIMPMLTMTLPIYRNKYRAQQSETKLLKTATAQNYQATTNAMKTDYYGALRMYNDAQRRIKLYDTQSRLAQQSLDIMIKTFSSSAVNLTDLLRIREQLLDYELKKVEATSNFNKAVAWIKRLIPTL